MTKIPVGKTIAYAYGFTFGNFLTVLGLSWVPLAIMAVAAYFALPAYFEGLRAALATGDPTRVYSGFGSMFLFGIVALMGFIMIYVGVARQALGLRTGPALFYFSLDAAFWRLLGAYLLAGLLAFSAMFLVAFGMTIAAVAFLGQGAGEAILVAALIPVMVFLCLIYLFLRLMFFQAAVAVAEGERIVRRSWSLSKGNFWRIFAVLLAIVVPLFIVQFAVQIAFFSSLMIAPPPRDAGPEAAAAFMAQLGTQFAGLLPFLAPIAAIFYAAFIGLITSASAFAYRSLVPAAEGTAEAFA